MDVVVMRGELARRIGKAFLFWAEEESRKRDDHRAKNDDPHGGNVEGQDPAEKGTWKNHANGREDVAKRDEGTGTARGGLREGICVNSRTEKEPSEGAEEQAQKENECRKVQHEGDTGKEENEAGQFEEAQVTKTIEESASGNIEKHLDDGTDADHGTDHPEREDHFTKRRKKRVVKSTADFVENKKYPERAVGKEKLFNAAHVCF
ncbi:hypothetical protein A3B32_00560 [Candidatus Uhrbacteria bacterium RIFCSPLOWO2_01_FULL_53_9]|uniref:Uncharacterized protein n=1 Tax=Candidatus Uhrbacteria bacterium RIFCSPLOWO2_01_FULL_53_9 TaxID=1802403 RepID=A0A1F7UY00_9BACT|nr:MAG: hypothetical protein A3B32_00560 [Candidatus Uhrbacteria bacterium RIFCSPLOWO2_01_FULL_53_9]